MVGYRVQNLDFFQSLYKCPYCLFLLRDPVQSIDCAHRMCQSCANDQHGDLITCSECNQTTSRDKWKLDRGCRNDMQTLSIICPLCDWTDSLKLYQTHLNQTHSNPVCEYCNEQFPSVNNLDRHIRYDCQKIPVDCPLKQFGCDAKILRINLNQHYLTKQHQMILLKFVLQPKLNSSIPMTNLLTTDCLSTTHHVTHQAKEIDETITVLSAGIETLNDDGQRIKDDCINHQNTLQRIVKDLSKIQKSVEEQNASLDSMHLQQTTVLEDIPSMQQQIDNIKLPVADGTLIWKLTNIKEKIEAAKSDRQSSIYSPPFYTSPCGYKMCLRLYLDGDGSAQKTHISLFFVLMRGAYDPILKFPFCFKVMFCLFDQTDKRQHIIDAFRPDVLSNSFQQPRADMNIASGIPKFAPVTIFQQENCPYIRDDTMFIKALIDFGDLPTTILPFVFNINPALTTQIQQTIIQQEIEKHQQQTTNFKISQPITSN